MVTGAGTSRSRAPKAITFILSNMIPRSPGPDPHIWPCLEDLARTHAKTHRAVDVVSGSAMQAPLEDRPFGSVNIPCPYYKVLLHPQPDGTVATLDIVLPNFVAGSPLPSGTAGVSGERISGDRADVFLATRRPRC